MIEATTPVDTAAEPVAMLDAVASAYTAGDAPRGEPEP